MRKIVVSASFGGKIPTGSYQNMNPSFYASEEFEVIDLSLEGNQSPEIAIDAIIKKRQQQLQAICYSNFEQEAIKAKILKIQQDRKDFHWYKLADGSEVPSVTSILKYDTDYFVDDEEMKQYAAQGIIIHAQVAEFITSGEWKNPKVIAGLTPELFILKKGGLALALEGWDFPAFVKKYQITNMKNGHPLINEKDRYGGVHDFECLYNNQPTLCDIKRTPDKVKNFMQIAAYAKCLPHIKQMMIVPLNDKTKQGFSEPIISSDIDKYYELFLYRRKEFFKVYGI